MLQLTCFLIDDDEDDREIFNISLEDAGKTYSCVTAKNGVNALEILKEDSTFVPNYIFLDLNMPLLSGKECFKKIVRIPRLKDVPIIIYTTSSHEKDIQEMKNLGASHFLIKPYSIGRLSEILTELFQKKNLPFILNPEN